MHSQVDDVLAVQIEAALVEIAESQRALFSRLRALQKREDEARLSVIIEVGKYLEQQKRLRQRQKKRRTR